MVSVIIPLYNKAEFIAECIESVLGQTYWGFEIVVVNDGSTDGSELIAAKYPVTVLNLSNRGVSGARNAGVLNSSGEFLLPLDADDKLHPEYLSKTVPLMEPGIGMV